MNKDSIQEKIKNIIEKNEPDVDAEALSELIIEEIWEDVETYIDDNGGLTFDD